MVLVLAGSTYRMRPHEHWTLRTARCGQDKSRCLIALYRDYATMDAWMRLAACAAIDILSSV